MNTIVLTGGGTAGHVMTHIAILDEIKQKFDSVVYIGSSGIEKSLLKDKVTFYEIPVVKYKRNFTLDNLLIPIKLSASVKSAKEILRKTKPNVVFSKGGYVALPVIIASIQLKIPVITHESDLSIGLTNKIVAKKCDKVLTTFYETSINLPNGLFVGPAIRKELFYKNKQQALKFFGFSKNLPVILVFGGSMGSKAINDALNGAIIDLLPHFQVLHICGNDNMLSCANLCGYKKVAYLENMSLAYSVCDIAISRSGSNSVLELMALNIPTLFIPLTNKVSRGDQIQNANYFLNKNMCRVLLQENLTPTTLKAEIFSLYYDKDKIISKMLQYKHTFANDKIVKILEQYLKK